MGEEMAQVEKAGVGCS